MSTYTKKLTNPKTGKKQVALCHDDYYANHVYGYGFKKDGSDFELMEDLRDLEKTCEFYKYEELVWKTLINAIYHGALD